MEKWGLFYYDDFLGTDESVTFVADWASYFPFESQFHVRLLLRNTAPSDAELEMVKVSAPGVQPPVEFPGGYTEWGNPDAYPKDIEAQQNQMASEVVAGNADPVRLPYPRSADIFLEGVRQGFEAGPFNVDFEAVLNTTFTEEDFETFWSFESGSVVAGRLMPNGLNATLEFDSVDPPVPGLYKIRCEVRVPGESTAPLTRTAVAYLLLPYAGPEITDWLIEEARQIANPLGVGWQWEQHVEQEANIGSVPIPFVGPVQFDLTRFKKRAFASVSWNKFDYTFHMTFNGALPTKRFNFTDAFRRSDDSKKDNKAFNDPSYATLQGIVVARQKITNLLWAVWGRSVGKSLVELRRGAQANNILRKWKFEDTSSLNGLKIGSDLYDSIVSGDMDAEIIANILTPGAVMGLQTDGEDFNDLRLWPRADFNAPPHTALWIDNQNLDDGVTYVRPLIFVPASDMDFNPFTNPQF